MIRDKNRIMNLKSGVTPLVMNEDDDPPKADKELRETLSHKLPKGYVNWNKFSGEMFISTFQKCSVCTCPLGSHFPLYLL